jgi:hypothetical protein
VVKRLLKVATAAVAVLAATAACAQAGPSIPPGATAGAVPGQSGSSASSPGAESTVKKVSAAGQAAKAQLGVQIYWHDVPDPKAVKGQADKLFDYVVGLNANSIGITFPMYTDGATPTKVYTKAGTTPTPSSLQALIGYAKDRGLRVMVRPIIDESNIKNGKGAWRGSIKPPSISAWFASYRKALTPYLAAAQKAHADVFVIGSELDSLVGKSSSWSALESAASGVFQGRLAYADNWGAWSTGRAGVPGAVPGLDAYPQLHLSDSASTTEIAAAWKHWLQGRPAGLSSTVVQEVGIAATPGAYSEPAVWGTKKQKLQPQIQAHWFAGACQAIRSLDMTGVYFWNLDAWADPAKASAYNAGSFIGRGDTAIKQCFASGWSGQ